MMYNDQFYSFLQIIFQQVDKRDEMSVENVRHLNTTIDESIID